MLIKSINLTSSLFVAEHILIDIYLINLNNSQDYEPTGTTPVRFEPDVPSKGIIESLRPMSMEILQEEFRENHSYESFQVKESKAPSLIPRSPLSQINQ